MLYNTKISIIEIKQYILQYKLYFEKIYKIYKQVYCLCLSLDSEASAYRLSNNIQVLS